MDGTIIKSKRRFKKMNRHYTIFDSNFFILLEFSIRKDSYELAEFYEPMEIKQILKFNIRNGNIRRDEATKAFNKVLDFYLTK